jgi:Spy/CpxP family protein refolding chaperone
MDFPRLSWQRFLVSASISLAVPLFALAMNQRAAACAPGSGMEGGRMPPYLQALNLSEAQRDKVFEIMHGQAPAMREKGKALRNAEESMRKLVLSPEYNEPKALELANSAAKAMSEMSLARAKAERQVYEVLTPEQRKQLADLKMPSEPPMEMRGERSPRGRGEAPPPPVR